MRKENGIIKFNIVLFMLQQQIHEDLKGAMRSGEALKRDVLRMLESAVKNAAIEKGLTRDDVEDTIVLEVIRRSVKQRKDSIDQYEQGGRPDLAEREKEELAILMAYLPAMMSEDEVRTIVQATAQEIGASAPSDFGKLMGKSVQAVNGRADGDVIKRIAQEILGM